MMSWRSASARPAFHPGARPPRGGPISSMSWPVRASTHATMELEFHISPVRSSSRPQVSAGTASQHSQHAFDSLRVVSGAHRAVDSFGDVRDVAAGPAPHFVAEDAETAEPSGSHWPFTDDTAVVGRDVPHRAHLDRVGDVAQVQHETGVVQIHGSPVLSPRRQPLVDAPVPAHDVAARAEREPEEVNPSLGSVAHGAHPRQSSTRHRDRQRPERPGTDTPQAPTRG